MKALPKLGVLISGKGTNLQSLIDHISNGLLQAEIAVVISNMPDAPGLTRAHKAKIPTVVVSHEIYENRKVYDRELLDQLKRFEVEWVALAGFMRILGTEFLAHYNNRVLNIHPSLLPKYPGLLAIQKACNNSEAFTGVTVHYVNEGVDAGKIILQEKVPIDPKDSLDSLKEKIHKVEHQIYPKAIQKVLWEE